MGCPGPGSVQIVSRRFWQIHFTVSRYVFPLPTFVISKKDSAARAMCKALPPLALMSSPSVGFFRAVAQDLLPEKSRPEAGLREQSSSEGGGLRVVVLFAAPNGWRTVVGAIAETRNLVIARVGNPLAAANPRPQRVGHLMGKSETGYGALSRRPRRCTPAIADSDR
jgi:hypothetical protein